MNARLLLVVFERETDIVLVRKRTRTLAELLGFDTQDRTRITTAVSEIARNAFDYAGGGRIEFRMLEATPPVFEIVISDKGPGIANLQDILSGSHRSATGMGLGILGARRLMDRFDIETHPGVGTTLTLGKILHHRNAPLSPSELKRIAEGLAADEPTDALDEIRRQNQELLYQLQELQDRQEDLNRLNEELHDTNRGVVALYAELDERADHLRRADELKTKFLSNMSHEFRTPLNSILALSRLLLTGTDGDLTGEQKKQIEFIRAAADSLKELVDDLLDIAKVEAGKTVIAPAEFTVEGLFGALRGMLRPLLVGDAVSLVFDDPADLPMLVTDEAKVSQILRNFISNAIKFTERGEVCVWATADPGSDTVTFGVRDTGIGIAEQDVGLIFQEFGQVAHALQSRIKGTGLGLPLAKRLAELLGGTIAVESAVGRGSVFTVRLPRVFPAEPEEAVEENWPVAPGRVPVLVVEDNPADAFALERMLARSRYQPVPTRTIAHAKRALERLQPAVIVLDVLLLGDECWRLILELRQQEATSKLPIIVVSSGGDERKALHLGADEYIQKPVDADHLIGLLHRLTGHASTVKVLLVDDDEVARYLVHQLLPRTHYAIEEAATGSEGLGRLERGDPPDVVVLDVSMPEMDGYQFLKQFRETEAFGRIPAVVLTSTVLSDQDRARLEGAEEIVSKSDLSMPILTNAIQNALQTVALRRVP